MTHIISRITEWMTLNPRRLHTPNDNLQTAKLVDPLWFGVHILEITT